MHSVVGFKRHDRMLRRQHRSKPSHNTWLMALDIRFDERNQVVGGLTTRICPATQPDGMAFANPRYRARCSMFPVHLAAAQVH